MTTRYLPLSTPPLAVLATEQLAGQAQQPIAPVGPIVCGAVRVFACARTLQAMLP